MQKNNDNIKVLIADDEIEFASALVSRLKLRNFRVSMANSGRATLEAVQNNTPDVLVLDLKMPDLNGFEILKAVKSSHPALEVIILTGHGAIDEGKEGIEQGAFDYIMKPVDLKHLIERIQKAAEHE